jgi:hypothetical protein
MGVQGQSRQKVQETPFQPIKKAEHGGASLSFSYPGSIQRGIMVQASLSINTRPYLKNN